MPRKSGSRKRKSSSRRKGKGKNTRRKSSKISKRSRRQKRSKTSSKVSKVSKASKSSSGVKKLLKMKAGIMGEKDKYVMTEALFAKAKQLIKRDCEAVIRQLPRDIKQFVKSMKIKNVSKNGKNISIVMEFVDLGLTKIEREMLMDWLIIERSVDKENYLMSRGATITKA